MFRYVFLAARSAVADAPKAAVNGPVAEAVAPVAAAAPLPAAFTPAAPPIGGARSRPSPDRPA
ncbi:hypothetical protein ACFWIP_12405, partial [Streptomyces anulatus]|uniref:hypothetical protein n=1 Tax=Streptomyces anulatus TaxID=1892 RepID=UPI003669140F